MGQRTQENIDWLMGSSGGTTWRNRYAAAGALSPETYPRFSLQSPAGGGSVNRLSSSRPLTRSMDLQQLPFSDFSSYCPPNSAINNNNNNNTNTNTTSMNNNNGFPNLNNVPDFSSYGYDCLLANELNQLTLSSPSHHHSQVVNNSSRFGGYSIPHSSFENSNAQYENYIAPLYNAGDLQRMRVDSAVRGQTREGLYMPYGIRYISSYEDASKIGYDPDHFLRQPSWENRDRRTTTLFHSHSFYPNRNHFGGRNGVQIRERERSFDSTISSSSSSRGGAQLQRHGISTTLVEDLRGKIFTAFEELRGKILVVARDQNGCRDLQKVLVEGKPEEKEMIYSELKNHIRELMVDQFANYLAQRIFDVSDEKKITELLLLVISDEQKLMDICLDMHGTRAMQKLLTNLTKSEQKSLVISALGCITVTLTKSINGHHVVEYILKNFHDEDQTYILNVVANNCVDIAMDKSGCCVLQQCVEYARGESRDRLIYEIIANAVALSEHPYGNYVVQFLLGLNIPQIAVDLLAQLDGNYVSLSMNKYGSNVVEKCLNETSEEHAISIIKEIIDSQNFLPLLQDPFGNYVAQSAISQAKGSIRQAMMHMIQINYTYLHSHPHGKRVLARARGSRQRV